MTTRPTLTLKDVRRKLKKLGLVKNTKRKGVHEIWDDGKGCIVPVSRGNQDVGPTLLKSICHELGITVDEFLKV